MGEFGQDGPRAHAHTERIRPGIEQRLRGRLQDLRALWNESARGRVPHRHALDLGRGPGRSTDERPALLLERFKARLRIGLRSKP